MKKNKFKDLLSIASFGIKIPEVINIESMEVDKYIYLQDDTLNPVILTFANFISYNLVGKYLFNIKIIKGEESLCYGKIVGDGDEDEDDDIESEGLRLLILMEALDSLFGIKNKNDLDFTDLIINWRKALSFLEEGADIDPMENIKMLITDNIKKIHKKNENKISNEKK